MTVVTVRTPPGPTDVEVVTEGAPNGTQGAQYDIDEDDDENDPATGPEEEDMEEEKNMGDGAEWKEGEEMKAWKWRKPSRHLSKVIVPGN